MADRESIFSKDVLLVMAASFFFMFANMYCNPLVMGFAKSLGASGSFAGLIVGCMSIVAMFMRPFVGNLTDHFSKYQLALVGGILSFIGILGYILTPNSQWLLLFRLINGTGYVLCTVCMTTWLSYLVPFSHVGEAMSFYGLMNALAMALAPAVSINLYRVIGYRVAIIISAVSALGVVVAIQFVSDHSIPKQKEPNNQHKHFKLIQKQCLPVAMIVSLISMPYFTTQADIVTYVEQRHLGVAVGFYFLIYAAFLLVIRLFLRNQFDTIRFGKWLYLGVLTTTAYLLLRIFMRNNLMMALAAAGMAFGYGILYSVCQSTAMMVASNSERGLASATFFLGIDIGMSFGPIIAGFVDSYLPINYFYVIWLLIIPLVLIIYWRNNRLLNGAIDHH